VPEASSSSDVEVTIRKLERYKSPGSDQIWGGGGVYCILRYISLLC
jgi:hypothetical protein